MYLVGEERLGNERRFVPSFILFCFGLFFLCIYRNNKNVNVIIYIGRFDLNGFLCVRFAIGRSVRIGTFELHTYST